MTTSERFLRNSKLGGVGEGVATKLCLFLSFLISLGSLQNIRMQYILLLKVTFTSLEQSVSLFISIGTVRTILLHRSYVRTVYAEITLRWFLSLGHEPKSIYRTRRDSVVRSLPIAQNSKTGTTSSYYTRIMILAIPWQLGRQSNRYSTTLCPVGLERQDAANKDDVSVYISRKPQRESSPNQTEPTNA